MDKAAYIEAADVIFCVSESTRRDLHTYFGESTGRIVVTPLGVDPRFSPAASKPPDLPERYVLYVGRREAYKDFGLLAQAFAMADLPNDIHLVAAGGGRFTSSEIMKLTEHKIRDRVRHREFGDDELRGAYANAMCFVFPSRHEGFGLPTLEAMASGCPTVLASSSSHLEVGGDSAVYFTPGDASELAAVLVELMEDPSQRAELTEKGLDRASQYTWRRTAELTAAGYLEAAK